MRKNGGVPREPHDVECGRELNHVAIATAMNHLRVRHPIAYAKGNGPIGKRYCNIIRNTIHISMVERTRFLDINDAREREFARYLYLKQDITTDLFKQRLHRIFKAKSKKSDTRVIIDLVITTITDIVFRFIEDIRTAESEKFNVGILDEINEIVDYANTCFVEIGTTYSNAPNRIVCDDFGRIILF